MRCNKLLRTIRCVGLMGLVGLPLSARAAQQPAAPAPRAIRATPATPNLAPAPTEREIRTLARPEAGATAADYRARAVTLRLYGTQGAGDAASATLADTANWATRTYRVGETVGRNLTLAAVREDAIELTDTATGTRRTVRAGEELRVRVIEHAFDFAATPHGEHQWGVQAATLARLVSRYGVGATGSEVSLHGARMIRLSAVQPQSALARLGFRAGDLLVDVNGEPARADSPAALCQALSQASSQMVLVTVVRGGARFEIAYAIE